MNIYPVSAGDGNRRCPLSVAAVLLAVLMVTLTITGCSGSAPSIDEMKWKVILRDDGSDRYEQLMIFARFSDPDDPLDPETASVVVGDGSLFWKFSRDAWNIDPSGGDWIGLPPMVAPGGFRLPDGAYVLRLEDLAARSTEWEFRPDPRRPGRNDVQWPVVSRDGDQITVEGPYSEGSLRLRDTDGAVIDVLPISPVIPFDSEGAASWELSLLRDGGPEFLLGPFPVKVLQTE